MARPAVFTWPVLDEDSIALTQSLGAAGALILNGVLVNSLSPPYAVFPGISRVVSLTSSGDASDVDFTITGTLNGEIVSETLAGPNSNTVETTQLFDTVTSVTADGAFGGESGDVSIGTGETGYTHWFNHNWHATVVGFTVQVNVTGTINYSFETTLDDVQTNGSPVTFEPITGTAVGHLGFPADMVSATTDQLAFCDGVARYSRIQVNSAGADGELVATFLQQGIT